MKSELESINWEERFDGCNNVDDIWLDIKTTILHSIEKHVPKRKKNSHTLKHSMRFTENTLSKIRKKHRMWQRFIETKDGQKHIEYCKIRNKVKSLIRKEKRNYEENIAKTAKTNPKNFWQYVNSKTKTKDKIPDLDLPDPNSKATSDIEKAEALNSFFSSVFTSEKDLNMPDFENITNSEVEEIEITEKLVKQKFANLKTNKSPVLMVFIPRYCLNYKMY